MITFVSGSFFAQSSFPLLFYLSLQYVVLRRQSYRPHFIGGEAKSWSHTEVRPRLSQCAMPVKENLPSSLHPGVRQVGHVEEREGQPGGENWEYLFNPLSGLVDMLFCL